MTGRLKFIQMSMVGRHLKYAALPNIAITSETRKVCFISFIHKNILKFVKSDDIYSSRYFLWYFNDKRAIIVHGAFEK